MNQPGGRYHTTHFDESSPTHAERVGALAIGFYPASRASLLSRYESRYLHKGFGTHTTVDDASTPLGNDESRRTQFVQMVREGGWGAGNLAADMARGNAVTLPATGAAFRVVATGRTAAANALKDRQPRWIGERLEDCRKIGNLFR
jgi:hypothetical protein